ncbi:hypothetical protein [Bradyrhizobium sp. SYSU BS000235]|uniref:hypothetical protein n=1 Tax=Bradyrhizobium sp. SYSU BS000235 TaxID=3411332 RepID=UPI003C73807A
MADYYPLIARAIAGLDPSAPGESRRALYERARSALIAQLRSVEPALSEAEITRERLALEDAVRRVEADAAKRAVAEGARPEQPRSRPESPSSRGAEPPAELPPPPPRREGSRPGDALRESARTARPPAPPSQRSSRPGPEGPESRPPRNLRADPPPPPLRPQVPPPLGPRSRGDEARASDSAQDFRGGGGPSGPRMRDVVADADDLGRATSQANRSARRTYSNVSPPADDRDPHGGAGAPYSYDESVEEAGHYQPQTGRPRGQAAVHEDEKPARRFPVKAVIAVLVLLALIGGGFLFYQKVYPSLRAMLKPTPVAEAPKDNGVRPKIADRVGQPGSTQIAPVAQRVVLYDEDPSSPQGKQYVGTVVWRTEPVKGQAGQPPDIGVRADIEIPERKFKMSLSIRRNNDASLPASHTAELTFQLPPDFGATVANVPGILMKSNEQARGTPLAGLAVKVTDGFFLVGLSNVEADKSRNLQLLKERSWFDIPLVYSNQRRSIIAIEKGAPGERAFNEAFTAWGE